MTMDIKELAGKYNDYIVERRRWFHQHPELSHKEFETTKTIVAELEKMGIEVTLFDGITGCVGTLRGGKPGSTVLLRADIDALPTTEKTGFDFASVNEGVMHSCGHDSHIAIQLGAAKILCELKDELQGTVKFFFQMAEETASGARLSVEQGLLEGVDGTFGMHVGAHGETGTFNMESGARMASADSFVLTIKGDTAHGSAPHLGHDAVVAASAVVMNLQAIVSRRNNPLNPLVLTVGSIHGGQRFNIIANEVVMEGTTRTYDRKVRMEIEPMMREIVESTAKCYGCTAELKYLYMTGPVINDSAKVVRIAQDAVKKMYGEDALISVEKLTGSEDFAYLMETTESGYGFLGCRNASVPGSERSNHHECYTIDEEALKIGASIYAQFAYDYLAEGK